MIQKSRRVKRKHHSRKESFAQRLLGLVSEPAFIRAINIQTEPNIFRIVGRAHYERWHSAFLGWLLDPQGSHLLDSYVLSRLLYLLFDERCLKPSDNLAFNLMWSLPTIEFFDVAVVPNENATTEASVKDVGRLDVFIQCHYRDQRNNQGKLNLIIELKIDSPTKSDQSAKYADWLYKNHPNDTNILIYLLPSLLSTSEATVGDKRWFCLDYQLLSDKLLAPVLDHPNLNDNVKPFIIQYIKNLKYRYKGIKMAITSEEKKLAVELYEKYADVFDSIYDALQSEGIIDFSTSDVPKGRASDQMTVRINGQLFSAGILRDLCKAILVYLVDNSYVLKIPLPWGPTQTRFVLSNQNPPLHPNGRPFFYPETYKGYTIETNYARERGLKMLDALCNKLDLTFEIIEA